MNNITWKYVKKLEDGAAIDNFETRKNIRFPKDLKEILIAHNGGRPSPKYYDLVNEKDKEFKTLLSFNESDVENIYNISLDSKDKTLVPFASDPAGNFFVLKDGKIYLWLHESDETIFVSDTFSSFLATLHD